MGFPCGSVGKESACNAGDLDSIPGLGRSPGEEKSYPLQYSGLENSMDCVIDSVAKRRMGPRDFHFTSLTFYGVVEIICRRNKQNINYVTCCGGKIWQTRDRFKGWSVLECPVKETGTCHLFIFFFTITLYHSCYHSHCVSKKTSLRKVCFSKPLSL